MPDTERLVRVLAHTVEEALRKASRQLAVAPSLLASEVVGARKSGLFGLGPPLLEVLVWVQDGVSEPEPEPRAGSQVFAAPAPEPPSAGWRVWCQDGSCYLEVTSAAAQLEDIEDYVREWPFDEYRREAVRMALSSSGGAPVLIGQINGPETDSGGHVFVKVTGDAMAAWLVPGAPGIIGTDEARQALASAGVIWGLDGAAIDALDGHELAVPIKVAQGTEATSSSDAAVEYLFSEEDDSLRPRVRDDGSVDFRDLKPMYTVQRGTVVGRYLPAVTGEAGKDVFGAEVAPVKPGSTTPAERFAGHDVVIAENGIDLVAVSAGRPVREGARIDIVDVYTIAGDVDYSTGNVDFTGEVYIVGDVQPGFSVRASGNVRIDGMVDSGSVAAGRDLLIVGGIQGHGESHIMCGGAMSVRFIDSADVFCDGDVVVISTLVRTTIVAAGQVKVMGRGSIIGGKVKAVGGIICNTAGSAAGVPTSLELDWLGGPRPGVDRERELARFRSARIVIYGDVYAGTTVTVNGAKFPVRDHLRAVSFQAADRGIALIPAG